GKENQFRVYKNYYTIFYPIITFFGHNPQRDFINQFTTQFVNDLGINNDIKTVSFDFQGARQQGSDRYWLAIYNKEQENQSTGLQFFIEFWHGDIGYGIHRHSDNNYLKPRVVLDSGNFVYEDMLNYFKTEVEILINDKPKYENLNTIDLQGNNLYKISHGSFKAKKNSHIVDYLKQNNWIVLHENTGEDQSKNFKTKLKKGDFVYITLGSKELIGIAKVVSKEWEYVPEEIVDDIGWMFREVEFIRAPVRKNPKDLKETKNIFPSGNSTLTEIKSDALGEANEKLFKPYFNIEFIGDGGTSITSTKTIMNESPLNQILYGPPGTGKTYNTINKAIAIANPDFDLTQSRDLIKIEYDRLVKNGQIVFTTFHQNMSYEDFIEGIKPETTQDDNVIYKIHDGIFKLICNDNQILKIGDKIGNYEIVDITNAEIYFNKPRGGILIVSIKLINQLLDFVKNENIENFKLGDNINRIEYPYLEPYYINGYENLYPKLIKHLIEENEKIDGRPKVLIIDEINRGNVSQIFGELITLIEEDKRLGKDEALEVTLPYSKDKFGVPANLFIIGTMNTADRSVEALDAALRRRFCFEEMPPLYDLDELQNDIFGYKAFEILKTINSRIEKLIDKDHAIGHSYLLNKDENSMVNSFYKNIIPLLQEYFFGDYGKLGLVLGKGFVHLKEWDKGTDAFADFDDDASNDFESRNVYEIIDYSKVIDYTLKLNKVEVVMDFEKAIQVLMNKKFD
ncbi:MAG: AAA family ATPase, partial [bacterium]|nr:AAA family ATPase [bacterium]